MTGIACAAFLTVAAFASAQTQPNPTPAQTPTQAKSSDAAATQTFAGCVMTERDYRRAHNLGDGQIGGVGLGDEYVLVDVKVSAAREAAATTPATGTTPARPETRTDTPAACADKGTAYRLTGSDEEQLRDVVGRQIEVQGRFKNADDAPAGGARPEGTLPVEVELISFREVPAPGADADPAAPRTPAQTVPPASPPVTPPTPTVDPARDQATAPATAERRELPQTASSTPLLGVIGVLTLSAGIAVTIIRRRLA
jgi:LPXTG-motif cell wall-anchored protein